MSSADDVLGPEVVQKLRAITISHNKTTMFIRLATNEHWITFEGPYDETQYHELTDPSNDKTIFQIEFSEMKRTGFGRLDGRPGDIKEAVARCSNTTTS